MVLELVIPLSSLSKLIKLIKNFDKTKILFLFMLQETKVYKPQVSFLQKFGFVIFMRFLTIFHKLSPTGEPIWETLGDNL